MSNYTKTTNFATKDSLPSGNPAKIVKGTEIDAEFNNIAVAVATKADSSTAVTLTGNQTLTNKTLTTPTIAGGTLTDNLSFGDSDKAQFGADDDLEIYHDGSNSYVVDGGTGNLFIGGASYVDIGNGVSGLGGQTYARFNTAGSCQLRHNGVNKIETTASGVDVNGSVSLTSGASDWSFTVSGNNLFISYGGTNKAKLDTSGNLTVVGNVTANGTI
jgi:hypothetical protein